MCERPLGVRSSIVPTTTCFDGYEPQFGRCYAFYSELSNFTNADALCSSNNGEITKIRNYAEFEYLKSKFNTLDGGVYVRQNILKKS